MTTFMSSAFTAADRRKKVVTYGKLSRTRSIPTLAPSSDAPSPERPRKYAPTAVGTLKRPGGAVKAAGSLHNARASTGSPDIFDVPSEDEFVAPTVKTTKKLPVKHRLPIKNISTSASVEKEPESGRPSEKHLQPLRKHETATPVAPTAKSTNRSVPQPKTAPTPSVAANPPVARRGKTPQPAREGQRVSRRAPVAEEPTADAKAEIDSRATAPALVARKEDNYGKGPHSSKAVAHTLAKRSEDTDIFDVPSTDDEAHMPTPRPLRRGPVVRSNRLEAPRNLIAENSDCAESDNSNVSNKRKRRGSVTSTATAGQALEVKGASAIPRRSRKHQKIDNNTSLRHESAGPSATITTVEAQPVLPSINKPKRTRTRTVPVINRSLVTKGQSSPAVLHGMLPVRHMSRPAAHAEVAQVTGLEDETMYEIPETPATPVRPSVSLAPGSITPRQKFLFSSLLGTSPSSSTPMPSVSKAPLTDPQPKSLLGALLRSMSDLTDSPQSGKTRLIDNLQHTESCSEDESSLCGSEEDSDEKEDYKETTTKNISKPHEAFLSSDPGSDEMNVVAEAAAVSQTSQATSGFGVRQRLTYAKSRSYLQEANSEDDLLMSMDLNNNAGFGFQTQDNLEEDEEDASQVRANHELKAQGENSNFRFANEMLIDDISQKSSNAVRRSAILEVCTKMADETFVHQLLDSSLVHQFLSNISSSGEIVFDFAAAVAMVFMLSAHPTYTIVNETYRSGIMPSLVNLLDDGRDIERISRDRKTNLSKIAIDSAIAFRTVTIESHVWSSGKPSLMSPQLIALKALELQILELRKVGNVDAVLDLSTLIKLIDIATEFREQPASEDATMQERLVSKLVLSTLESVSLANPKHSTWSTHSLQRLAGLMPVFFQAGDGSTITLAVKLCMNLTNNKPKACRQFSEAAFVHSLLQAIIHRYKLLHTALGEEQRTETLETLILSLGAMINLTEHSDQARTNVDDGKEMIGNLVEIFLDGSARAAQAESMEESQSSVAVGYLSVLLGNICLNEGIKAKLRARLPNQQLAPLIDKIKEFVRVHEQADRRAKQFDSAEGQETWQNYTARLMVVVNELEKAEG